MISFLKDLWYYIRPQTEREMIDEWLGKSKDLAELERRQQHILNPNLKGWV